MQVQNAVIEIDRLSKNGLIIEKGLNHDERDEGDNEAFRDCN